MSLETGARIPRNSNLCPRAPVLDRLDYSRSYNVTGNGQAASAEADGFRYLFWRVWGLRVVQDLHTTLSS